MGRKRSIAQEVLQREARRKKANAVKRLNEWHYCPACRKKSIETDFVTDRRGNRIREKTLIDGPHGKEEVTCHMAASICRSCGRKKVVWLLPWEELIDLYHLLHDEIGAEVRYVELFEWLYSEIKESKEDIRKREQAKEEAKAREWRHEVIQIKGDKEVIPEPRLTE